MRQLAPILAALASLTLPLAASAQRSERPTLRGPLMVITPAPSGPIEKVGAKTIDVQVTIVGRLAETRMTLTFGNPHGRPLAGDLYLPLPEHATVSGYALDVAGRMVDGVVVEKHEARRIFEKEVRKGVDPGLVEWTQGNVFKTRVFPIPANGTRTVMVRWVTPLAADGSRAFYELPLSFPDPVDLGVRIEVRSGARPPLVSGDGPLKLDFHEAFVAETHVTKTAVVQALRVTLPDVSSRPVQVERGADGSTWFAIQDAVPVPELPAPAVRRVRVLWDASLSRDSAKHDVELALLGRLLAERFPDATVEVVVLRHEAEPPRQFERGAAAVEFLRGLAYDGGTQLARLRPLPGAATVDVQLVFTDGLSTFGDDDPGALGAPTWFISSSLEAAHDGLAHLAKRNGGAYFNLLRASADAALAAIGRPTYSLLAAKVVAGEVLDLVPGGAEPVVGPTFVAGRLVSDEATIEVQYGIAGQPANLTRKYVVVKSGAPTGDLVSRAWAERTLSALLASPQRNANRITELGKAHGIVTPGTSLLVLETLAQYVEYGVRPPATLADVRAAWDAAQDERRGVLEVAVRDRLKEVAELWAGEVAWYEQKFSYPAGFRFGGEESRKSAERTEAFGMDGASGGAARPGEPSPAEATREQEDRDEGRPAAKADKKSKDGDAVAEEEREPGVSLSPWNPQTPYVIALKKAAREERLKVYLAQRAEFGTAPSFFLDVSDFFMNEKDSAMALQVLSNIAELRLGDPALLRILGHRLAQLDRLDYSVRAFEEVLRQRPEEPQSYRDLALVLGRRAESQPTAEAARSDDARALGLLAEIVKRRWDRFEAIEIMALTEMNALWPKAKAAGVEAFPLDARFVHPMALDVRIVMTWDADMTDMDLHVLEPSDEEAYYSHNLTTIGGRVSRDFTQGYGPEVYSIRKAMPGPYKVKTKFFGSSAAQLQGAVTLQVDVFTNWGRPNQKRQSMTLRLTERKEDFLVGEIRF